MRSRSKREGARRVLRRRFFRLHKGVLAYYDSADAAAPLGAFGAEEGPLASLRRLEPLVLARRRDLRVSAFHALPWQLKALLG